MQCPTSLRYCLLYTVAISLITLAVIFSAARAVLPYADGYLSDIESALTEQIGLPVSIRSLDAEMDWFTPRLVLVDATVYQQDGLAELIHFDEIELELAYLDSIRYQMPMVGEINLVGGDILVERFRDDRWVLQGIEFSRSSEPMSAELKALIENANFALIDSRFRWIDHTGQYDAVSLTGVNIAIDNFLGDHTIDVSLELPEQYGDTLRVAFDFSGSIVEVFKGRSSIYIDAKNADLKSWIKSAKIDTPYMLTGKHDLQLWLDLERKHLVSVSGKLDSDNLAISTRGLPGWQADKLTTDFYWKQHNQQWRAYVSDFSFSRQGYHWKQPGDIIVKVSPDDVSISASYLDVTEIKKLVQSLFSLEQYAWVSTLDDYDPEGELYNLYLQLAPDSGLPSIVRAQAIDLGIDIKQQGIAFNGLDISLDYHAGSGTVDFVTTDGMFTMTPTFRHAIELARLQGRLSITKGSSAWVFDTEAMRLENKDITTVSRARIELSGDDDVTVDIQTAFENASGAAAHRYYPVSVMSKELVDWLDEAITDGKVPEGGFLLYGDVAAFPFRQDGVMQVDFVAEGVDLNFQPGWPVIDDVHADISFDNTAMRIVGSSGSSFDSELVRALVTIDDLYDATVIVHGAVKAPAGDIQKYIWASPLDTTLGAAVNQVQLSGATDVTLSLEIPLEDEQAEIQTRGEIRFTGDTITYPDLDYQFKDVRGNLYFTDTRLWSEALQATLGGEPVDISVAHLQSEKGESTHISLAGNLETDYLLRRFDWLPENWLSGRSDWDVTIDIPHYSARSDVSVVAQSQLQGTRVDVSDVVSKPAGDAYPVKVEIEVGDDLLLLTTRLPDSSKITSLRESDGSWKVDADTPPLAGKISFHESLSTDRPVIMDLDRLHLSDLVLRADQGEAGYGVKPFEVPSLNIHAKDLRWKDWKFDKVYLDTSWHPLGMLIAELEIKAQNLEITGQGSWLTSWRVPNETSLKVSMRSTNMGNMLIAQGYQRYIDRSTQSASLNLKWQAEPYNFSWEKLEGTANFVMRDGIVMDVKPGTGGRILGLLNVFHLPRRLILDFKDVYKKGFVFDSIKGDIEFSDGNAVMRNTEIVGAAADIRLIGRVGMEAQDYDLSMRVKPNQAAASFTGGTIIGGPVVGAGLVLVQKLLGLDKASQDVYTITGAWDDPVLTQVKKRYSADEEPTTDETDDELIDEDDDV